MKTLAWFVSLAALLASPAWAQDDFGRAGPYAAFLGVGAIETFDEPSGLDFSDGGGFNMRAGYRFMEYVAAEMQFEYVEGFSDQGIDIESWNLMWNVKGFPLTGRVQPYALFGMGVLYAEASGGGRSIDDEGFAVRVGGGMDFYATENIVLTGEVNFVQPTGDVDDLSYVTIGGGLQYRF